MTDINQIIYQLTSPEAQANIVSSLSGHVSFTPQEILRAAQTMAGKRDYLAAARLTKTNAPENSRKFYEQAILAEETAKKHNEAATICIEAGQLERAINNYEQGGNTTKAAALAEKQGQKEKAAKLYEESKPTEAARIYSELGQHEKASELFEKAGQMFDAYTTARDAGQKERAVNIWIKIGNTPMAAHVAKTSGLADTAKQLYKQAIETQINKPNPTPENYAEAAFLAKQDGRTKEEILGYYEKGALFNRAREYCEETNDAEKAQVYSALQEFFEEIERKKHK